MIKAQDEVHTVSLEQGEQTSLARIYRIKGMEGVGKQEELEKGTLCLMGAMESFSGFLSIGIELSKATV